jgi:hypothetical protein
LNCDQQKEGFLVAPLLGMTCDVTISKCCSGGYVVAPRCRPTSRRYNPISHRKKTAKKGESGRGAPTARGPGALLGGNFVPELTRTFRAAGEGQEDDDDAREANYLDHRYTGSFQVSLTTGSFSNLGTPASMRQGLHSIWYSCTPCKRYTPTSGIFSRASLNRLVKFAMHTTRVNSTICPSS